MVLLGLLIGLVFPPAIVLMGVPADAASTPSFRALCLAAGTLVGALNHVVVRVVLGRRLATLANRLDAAAGSVRNLVGQPSAELRLDAIARIPSDSRDELGACAAAFNEVLGALAEMERFRAIVLNSTDLLVVMDPDGRVTGHTGSLERALGRRDAELGEVSLTSLVHRDDLELCRSSIRAMLTSGDEAPTTTFVCRVLHADGSWRHLEVVASDRRLDPSIAGVLLACRDVGERVALQDELTHQALHDGLTGLANRVLFGEQVERARRRRRGAPVAVLFCDLDDFKNVNDGYGHAAGDAVLVEVARRLEGRLRGGDVAARLGGDEFAVLLDDTSSPAEARAVTDRIVAALAAPMVVDGRELRIRCSVGIAVDPGDDTSTDDLLRDADTAMYVAKSHGKGRATLFEPSLHEALMERVTLERDLSRAVERGELILHYQPVLDLESGRATSVEALVRWQHPERGLLGPDRFIGLAEETGLVVDLGRWVLREACRQAVAWRRDPSLHGLGMAVNVSARQLDRPEFVGVVAQALHDTGLDASSLTLELTETAIAADDTELIARLRSLRSMGVRIAIDDFGTGYSSLSYLRRLPVDTVKIDRSFVGDLGRDAALVRMVTELASELGLDTVAEGIEEVGQLDALRGFTCRHGQGYLFSRPVTPDAIPHVLAAVADLDPDEPRPAIAAP